MPITTRRFLYLSMFFAPITLACTMSPGVGLEPSPRQRLLQHSQDLRIAPRMSALQVTGRHSRDRDNGVPKAISIIDGTLRVRGEAAGALTLESLDIRFGDVVIPRSRWIESDIHLTDIRIRLESEATGQAMWLDHGAEGSSETKATLVLDWSFRSDGETLRLGSQRIRSVPLRIHVQEDALGRLRVNLTGHLPGVFWEWAGLLELSDLFFDLNATEEIEETEEDYLVSSTT
ncbi:MAG: hypothetical protein HY698_07300 [Deltaproteobacteria bacterium]|nr:hypothetical protein [Deltaproteobacteria bacterium]